MGSETEVREARQKITPAVLVRGNEGLNQDRGRYGGR